MPEADGAGGVDRPYRSGAGSGLGSKPDEIDAAHFAGGQVEPVFARAKAVDIDIDIDEGGKAARREGKPGEIRIFDQLRIEAQLMAFSYLSKRTEPKGKMMEAGEDCACIVEKLGDRHIMPRRSEPEGICGIEKSTEQVRGGNGDRTARREHDLTRALDDGNLSIAQAAQAYEGRPGQSRSR